MCITSIKKMQIIPKIHCFHRLQHIQRQTYLTYYKTAKCFYSYLSLAMHLTSSKPVQSAGKDKYWKKASQKRSLEYLWNKYQPWPSDKAWQFMTVREVLVQCWKHPPQHCNDQLIPWASLTHCLWKQNLKIARCTQSLKAVSLSQGVSCFWGTCLRFLF